MHVGSGALLPLIELTGSRLYAHECSRRRSRSKRGHSVHSQTTKMSHPAAAILRLKSFTAAQGFRQHEKNYLLYRTIHHLVQFISVSIKLSTFNVTLIAAFVAVTAERLSCVTKRRPTSSLSSQIKPTLCIFFSMHDVTVADDTQQAVYCTFNWQFSHCMIN